MTLWKINCMEDHFPGMWHRWLRQQCVAVGWHSKWGFPLVGDTDDRGWLRTRPSLKRMKVGDLIVVALRDNRVGRIGQITAKRVADDQWDPPWWRRAKTIARGGWDDASRFAGI